MGNTNAIWPAIENAARGCESWADFSNELFSGRGLLAELIPDTKAQRAFLASNKNRLRLLFDESVRKHGVIEGSQPKKSANMLVRLPQSLHSELKHEAEEEGVSLNQLVILKLAAQLKHGLYRQSKKHK